MYSLEASGDLGHRIHQEVLEASHIPEVLEAKMVMLVKTVKMAQGMPVRERTDKE